MLKTLLFSVKFLIELYPDRLQERFELAAVPHKTDDPDQIFAVMEDIGRKRGCLQSGGFVNLEKAAGVILRELRAGKLGRISLEIPSK